MAEEDDARHRAEDARHRAEAERIAALRFPPPGITLAPHVVAWLRAGYAAALVWGWRDMEHQARLARLKRGRL